jgi:hypothetical protein
MNRTDFIAESKIDEAILAIVGARWMKVAMVLAKTAEALDWGLPTEDGPYE